jgi:hypothetical protein
LKAERALNELDRVKKLTDRKINQLERNLQYQKVARAGAEVVLDLQQRQVELDHRQSKKDKRQLEIDRALVEQQLLLCRQESDRFRSRTDSIREERLQMKEFRSRVPKIIDKAVHTEAHKVEARAKSLQKRVTQLQVSKKKANQANKELKRKLDRTNAIPKPTTDTIDVLSSEDEAPRIWEVKQAQLNKGMSPNFEEHVRCLMATGTTSRQTREGLLLNAAQFLSDEELQQYRSEIPGVEWFAKQREALGVESYLYTFMRIAGCDSIRQWGFDETKIDGNDTFNQWAMLIDPQASGSN